MVNFPSQLQLAALDDNKKFFCNADIIDVWERVCDKWKDRCLFVATSGGVGETMERGKGCWCDKITKRDMHLCLEPFVCGAYMTTLPMVYLQAIKWRVKWPTLYVGQMWIWSAPTTWRKIYMLDIDSITLIDSTQSLLWHL